MRKGRIPQLQGNLLFVLGRHFTKVYDVNDSLQEFRVISKILPGGVFQKINLAFDLTVLAMALDAMT